jgi:hypothetical protein
MRRNWQHFSVPNNIDFIRKFVSAISLLFDSRRGEFCVLFWLHRRIWYINLCFVIFLYFSPLSPSQTYSPFSASFLFPYFNFMSPLSPALLSSPTSSFPYFFPYFVSFIPSKVIPYLFLSRVWGSYHLIIMPSYHHILGLSIIIQFSSNQ